jgi:hypothetical protein
MWADLPNNKWFYSTWEIELEDSVSDYDAPTGLHEVLSAQIKETCVDIGFVDEAVCSPSAFVSAQQSQPNVFWIEGTTLSIYPTPTITSTTTLSIRGIRVPTGPFWTDEIVEDVLTRTWEPIDLPELYHSIFAKLALGFAYIKCEDFGAGEEWLAIASEEMKGQLTREPNPTAVFYVGGDAPNLVGCTKPLFAWEAVHGGPSW